MTARRRRTALRFRPPGPGRRARGRRPADSAGRAPAATGGEEGFTLLEILITVVILGIVLTTLTAAVIMGFRSNARVESRTDRSNLVGFASRSFNRDVASATAAPVENAGCGSPVPVVKIPLEGGLSAAYAVETLGSPTRWALVRRVCNGSTVNASRVIGSSRWPITNATASCTTTGTSPDTVTCGRLTLDLEWGGPDPYTFSLSADRRATAS